MRSSRWLTMIALVAKKQFNPPWGQDCCERPTPLLGDYVQLSRCEPQETTTVLAAVGGHQRRPALVAVLVPMVSSRGLMRSCRWYLQRGLMRRLKECFDLLNSRF